MATIAEATAEVNRVWREFKRYTGDGLPGEPANAALPVGDPQSGPQNAKKSELRAMLIAVLVAAGLAVEAAEDAVDRAEIEADRAEAAADAAEAAVSSVSVTSFPTKAAAEAFAPAVGPTFLRLEGYTAAGDNGGALYKKVASEPTHAGKFFITLADAVTVAWYEIAEAVLTPQMFGAKGDGAADETDAFDRLFSMPSPLPIHVPGGEYLLSRQVVSNGKNISITGAGMGATKLRWTAAATSLGLRFLDNSGISSKSRAVVSVQSLTLATMQAGAGSALSFNYSVGDDSPFGETPTVTLRDLDIRGDDFYEVSFAGSDYWQTAVDLVDTGSVVIDGLSIVGIPGQTNDAIRIEAVESPNIRFFINSTKAVYICNGLHIVCGSGFARVEGVYLSQTEFVACLHGILVEGGPSHAVQFENGHIDSDAACVDFSTGSEGSVSFKLAGSYISMGNKWGGNYISGYAVSLPQSVQSTITGNRIEGDPGKTVVQGGAILQSSNGCLVSDNAFNNFTSGVALSGSCVNCHATDNVFNGVTTSYVGSGTGCSFGRSGSGFADLFGGMKVRSGSNVITLDASGNGQIPLNPAFPAAYTSAVICNGEPSLFGDASFCVRHDASSASTLAVAVRPNPGAVTVRVNWTAFGT